MRSGWRGEEFGKPIIDKCMCDNEKVGKHRYSGCDENYKTGRTLSFLVQFHRHQYSSLWLGYRTNVYCSVFM